MRSGPLVAAATALNLFVVSLFLLLACLSLDIHVSRAVGAASVNAAAAPADDYHKRREASGEEEGPGEDYDPLGLQVWSDGE